MIRLLYSTIRRWYLIYTDNNIFYPFYYFIRRNERKKEWRGHSSVLYLLTIFWMWVVTEYYVKIRLNTAKSFLNIFSSNLLLQSSSLFPPLIFPLLPSDIFINNFSKFHSYKWRKIGPNVAKKIKINSN